MLSIQNISLYCIYTRILQVNYVTQSIRNANTLSWRIWNVRGCQGSLCVPDHFHGFLQKLSRPVQLLKRCKFRKWVECENMEIHGNTEYCTIIEHRNRRQLALLLNDDLLRIYIYIYIYVYIYIYLQNVLVSEWKHFQADEISRDDSDWLYNMDFMHSYLDYLDVIISLGRKRGGSPSCNLSMVDICELPSQFPRNIWNSFLATCVKTSRHPGCKVVVDSICSSQQTLAYGLFALSPINKVSIKICIAITNYTLPPTPPKKE